MSTVMPRNAAATPAPPIRRGTANSPDPHDAQVARARRVVDPRKHATAHPTWTANRLSRGASKAHLAAFGMDKGQVSQSFNSLHARGLIHAGLDTQDGRLRMASITPEGQALHDSILDRGLALEREQATQRYLRAHYPQALRRACPTQDGQP